jgi:pimeloyl-ACP methyl ester carboxylesterase
MIAAREPAMTDTGNRRRIEQVIESFLTPNPPRQRLPLTLQGARPLRIDTPHGTVALLHAGSGPAVLLLHGWEGQSSDMAAFAQALLERGFSVFAMDLPAHGKSSGAQTSIPQSAMALRAAAGALPPLHAVIAHSVGAPVVVEALAAGMQAQRVVLLSAPARYEDYARRYAMAAGLNPAETGDMLALLRESRGIDVGQVSLPARAARLAQPALFIHSADDRVVPVEDSIASAAAWPGARHLRVDGLGHRRLLADAAVVAAAVEFVAEAAPALSRAA